MSYELSDDVIEVQRGPEPGGLGGAYRTFGATLRGMRTTLARLAEKPVTIEYPEEKTPVYPRFRGRHKLHRFEDSHLEKCVGCSLCTAACPADCIRVVAKENDPDNRVSITNDGRVRVSYTRNNSEAYRRLRASLVSVLEDIEPDSQFLGYELGVSGVSHQNGTLKFGDDPRSSVLDRFCRAHEVDNLYACDASFFPSCGAVNV